MSTVGGAFGCVFNGRGVGRQSIGSEKMATGAQYGGLLAILHELRRLVRGRVTAARSAQERFVVVVDKLGHLACNGLESAGRELRRASKRLRTRLHL